MPVTVTNYTDLCVYLLSRPIIVSHLYLGKNTSKCKLLKSTSHGHRICLYHDKRIYVFQTIGNIDTNDNNYKFTYKRN